MSWEMFITDSSARRHGTTIRSNSHPPESKRVEHQMVIKQGCSIFADSFMAAIKNEITNNEITINYNERAIAISQVPSLWQIPVQS
ncbi:hypothetical protein H6G82_02650 [Planktothricoides sp. FACHB-1261]|uniref:hypothetical protein n=1 Tax=Planktothricoides sp. SR001 TaxID=1705388 RepID=UPI0012E2E4F4|nr:hypothetical protein [Planktothricoides sp. SR001]MBD2581175.1 hypothetical protein [Planktothricoides raciborskii FACHB-1261]